MSERDRHHRLDAELRTLFEAGDLDATATLFLRHYGPHIMAFLIDRTRNPTTAADVFGQFAEDFWSGLPNFRWQASLRAWAFTLARNAAYQQAHAADNRVERNVTLPPDSQFNLEFRRCQSTVRQYLMTKTKTRFRDLVQRHLDEEDLLLLVLRVDQALSWTELVAVLHPSEGPKSAEQEQRLSANLRKRFSRLKDRLRTLAVSEGLLEE